MKYLAFIIPLFIIGCAAADITIDRENLKPVKTVLIAPFTSEIKLKKDIYNESEEKFRSTFVRLGYRVIERDRLDTILDEKEYSSGILTPENIKTIAKRLGADAVLTGEILEHREYTEVERPFMMIIGNRSHDGKQLREQREKTTIHYVVKISVKLINADNGTEIFTVKNRYGNYESDYDEAPQYLSLDVCRRDIIDKMTNELAEAVSGKK